MCFGATIGNTDLLKMRRPCLEYLLGYALTFKLISCSTEKLQRERAKAADELFAIKAAPKKVTTAKRGRIK